VTLRLRPHVTFHDGSPLDAAAVAKSLRDTLPKALGAVFEDIDSIAATSDAEVTIRFRRPSPFVLESFVDIPFQKPGSPGTSTGPFMAKLATLDSKSSADIEAYGEYDLGRPRIGRIVVNTYPNVRAAWADLLRDRLDMLYEVGVDALDSMQGAKNVSLYTFDRPFQYMLILSSRSPKLKSREVRRALNQAIDRSALVRDGLSTHGTPSAGPVSQHHWAFEPGSSFDYVPAAASATLAKTHSGRMSLKCLTPAGPPYERLALVLKQQLQAVGVDMSIDEVSPDNLGQALSKPDFEALLIDVASGWSLFRPYRWWHSKGTQNVIGFSSASVDSALDRVRHAANEDDYRAGAAAFQQAIADNPPAIFLAWGDRSRAVSSRFDVQAQTGRDVLASLRLWRPTTDIRKASRN
jgi:peptide/nickel transport system substrate-binding protein